MLTQSNSKRTTLNYILPKPIIRASAIPYIIASNMISCTALCHNISLRGLEIHLDMSGLIIALSVNGDVGAEFYIMSPVESCSHMVLQYILCI